MSELLVVSSSPENSLLDQTLDPVTLSAAWRVVYENDGAQGADAIVSEELGQPVLAEITSLAREVRRGSYVPGPLFVGTPCFRDKVLQSAAALVVSPILDRLVDGEGNPLQPCRSVDEAIAQISTGRDHGFRLVVKTDLGSCLEIVAHQTLLDRLAEVLHDTSLQPLFKLWLAMSAGTDKQHCAGLARGAPILLLFARLYLSHFDTLIRKEGRLLIRYAEKFIILCKDCDTAEQALEDADHYLCEDGLELDFSTTRITSFANGFEFLGTRFEGDRQWSIGQQADIFPLSESIARSYSSAETVPTDEIDAQSFPTSPPLLRTVHVTEHGAYLHRRGGRIVVSRDETDLFEIPLEKIDQVCVAHEGKISFGAMRDFLSHKIGFVITSHAGDPVGSLDNLSGGNAILHSEQFRRADDSNFCLNAARAIVAGKIANCRLIVRRYGRNWGGDSGDADSDLALLERRLAKAENLDVVRGLEGAAARRYFEVIGSFLGNRWNFNQRNRRPPRDPVNVLLSYGYAILFQNVLTLLVRRGLHPYVGARHALADRHPGLVSDLMEEFRPLVVDAVVLKLMLNSRIKPEHFELGCEDNPCRLLPIGRRIFVKSIEEKLDTPLKHPQSGKMIDLRRAISGQASLWAEHVCRRTENYRPFVLH